MKLELELNGQNLHALSAEEPLEGYACVVDLRKRLEMETSPAAQCKAQGVNYVHVPVTAETLSEQDMDFVRRECARHWGKLAVMSKGGHRAAAVLLMHVGRSGQLSEAETLKKFPELEAPLETQVKAYLARHREVTS